MPRCTTPNIHSLDSHTEVLRPVDEKGDANMPVSSPSPSSHRWWFTDLRRDKRRAVAISRAAVSRGMRAGPPLPCNRPGCPPPLLSQTHNRPGLRTAPALPCNHPGLPTAPLPSTAPPLPNAQPSRVARYPSSPMQPSRVAHRPSAPLHSPSSPKRTTVPGCALPLLSQTQSRPGLRIAPPLPNAQPSRMRITPPLATGRRRLAAIRSRDHDA